MIALHPGGVYWVWYLVPALLFYVFFMAWPLIDSLRLSFFVKDVKLGTWQFSGLANYRTIFTDPEISQRYWGAFGNTWIFFLIHMAVQNVLGILFAVILTNRTMRARKLYQTIIFLPVTLAVLVTGYMWQMLLNPIWMRGLFTKAGLGFLIQPWLGNEKTALICVALVSCWQWVGIPTMMFVAGLMNISDDLYEVADIEGANSWQTFAHIKLPLLMPVVGMIAILTFVNNFNAFDVVYATENMNGAPGYSTDLIGTLFYRTGIAGQHPVGIPNPGLGAAMATITFVVLTIGVLPTLYATQTKE